MTCYNHYQILSALYGFILYKLQQNKGLLAACHTCIYGDHPITMDTVLSVTPVSMAIILSLWLLYYHPASSQLRALRLLNMHMGFQHGSNVDTMLNTWINM